jgi:putative transposase
MSQQNLNAETSDSKLLKGQILTDSQRTRLLEILDGDVPDKYRKRISIMLLADDGRTPKEISEELKCSIAMAKTWILVASAGQINNWRDASIGRPRIVNETHIKRLRELLNLSPRDVGYAFTRWTGESLSRQMFREFSIKICPRHINRLVKQLELSDSIDL